MKTTIKLTSDDIIDILTERFGASSVRLDIHDANDDGPGRRSPAHVTAEIVVRDDAPVIAQQTVVMGSASFGPTTIVMPPKRG